ncbi:IS1096 element passenger TnpR family protein [Cupriavidus sp. D39]|uniref:IS1096 element passenger TnpR family protein n=1 Tax=Cupriavidus sp. D39 TaxID=2997877 RepID=UPI003B6351D2
MHSVIQVVMGWTDEHLHQFTIRGRRYGEAHEGVLQYSTVANELTLAAFSLREREGFVYVYDFNAWWRHDIRVERRRLRQRPGQLPLCVAGCGP